jgi:phosphoglycolate phosphatase
MDRRFDLIVFDWDGTLMDSTPHIAESFRAACADLGLTPPSPEDSAWIIGMGLAPALQRVLPELDPIDYPRLSAAYRRHFLAGDTVLPLFPGIAELVPALEASGNLLAVATGKSRVGLERAFDQSGLRQYFHVSCCADESFAKPNPDMLFRVMERTGAFPQRTLMIGDTGHDLQMAANAGVQALGVSYGAHPREALLAHPAAAVLDSSAALIDWLAGAGQLGPARRAIAGTGPSVS